MDWQVSRIEDYADFVPPRTDVWREAAATGTVVPLQADAGWHGLVAHLAHEHQRAWSLARYGDVPGLQNAHAHLHGIGDLLARPAGQVWTVRWHPPTSGIVGTPEEVDYGRWLDDVWWDARTSWTSFCHDGWEHERCDGWRLDPRGPLCGCPCHNGDPAAVWSHAGDEGRRR